VIDEVNSYESEPFVYDDSLNLPIARGKASWTNFCVHDIANYVSYDSLSIRYSLYCFTTICGSPKRSENNKTQSAMRPCLRKWNLHRRTRQENATYYKWVYNLKQNLEGKTKRYKVILVARGYSQTYRIEWRAICTRCTNEYSKNSYSLCC
jgi:hypothetical protein